jgi:UDP-N-acetylglucosamine--N-acetylmuramyl-(pentapeptide) pyrophosphoryl-undecaprenol N-acetylglucosamine transferase
MILSNRNEIRERRARASTSALRLALVGGGTGGHLVPGLHVLEHARARGGLADLVWFTSGREVEERVLGDLGARCAPTPARRVVLELEPGGGGAPSRTRLVLRTPPAVMAARVALVKHKPDVLLALGGFTCLPAVIAARSLGIPVALLEINAARGAATRWLARFSARVFHAWPATVPEGARLDAQIGFGSHRLIGPPLAQAFTHGAPARAEVRAAREHLGFDPDRPLLLVLGGSQGALGLNRFVQRHAGVLLLGGLQVLHQTGPGRAAESAPLLPGYRAQEYIDPMHAALCAATLALTRGGASTLAEIAALCLPALVVPYPHHADRHQERNARSFGEGLRIVPEARLGPEQAFEIARLCSDTAESERARMSAALEGSIPLDAAERLLDGLLELARAPRSS